MKSLKKFIVYILLLSAILSLVAFFIFSKYISPRILSLSRNFVENEVSMIVDDEVKNLMLEEFLSYDKITIISRDVDGKVNSISINSVLINNFTNELDIKIGDKIDSTNVIENYIYLSGLIGSDLFSGFGPKIPIRFQPVSVTDADISHTFEEAGINQTIHTITLTVSVDVEVLLPFSHSIVTVNSQMPVAQTIIVGTVPQTYFNKK